MKRISMRNLILLICCFAFLILGAATIISISANYQEIYGYPRVNKGVISFEGISSDELKNSTTSANLSGEWEFFYNRWIVTDNDDGEADGYIRLPARWTGMKINGKKLSKSGYASYRLTVTDLDIESLLIECSYVSNTAYRIFINGELSAVSGTVSKNRFEAFATGTVDEKNRYYVSRGESLTVVIETAYNNEGGLLAYPWLIFRPPLAAHDWLDYTLPNILLGGVVVAILFCFFLPISVLKNEKLFALALFLFAMFLHYLVGVDFFIFTFRLLSLSTAYAPLVRYLTGVLLGVSHVFNLASNKIIVLSRAQRISLIAANAVAFVAFFALSGTNLQIIPIAVSLVSLLWISYKIATSDKKIGLVCANILINTFLFAILTLEALDSEGLIVFTSKVMFSVGAFIILLTVIFLNFYRIYENQKTLFRAAQLETEIAVMKNQTLKGQIKPHFIFNSLSAIKDVYRKDSVQGEEMLTRFSAHLRANVDSDNKDLIPFEDELNNMLNYFELENLRYENKLTLVLNVEYTNFTVPVLSLQPFLENAVKYAGTQSKKDGQIQISAVSLADGSVIVEVSDNGCGFDMENIRVGAVGIQNATERLKYSLDAKVTVKSAIGAGTTVTIIIPKNKSKEDESV